MMDDMPPLNKADLDALLIQMVRDHEAIAYLDPVDGQIHFTVSGSLTAAEWANLLDADELARLLHVDSN